MHNRAFSVNEAAFVTERPAKEVTREFDEGVFNEGQPEKGVRTKNKVRSLGPQDLRYFRLMKHWGNDFSPDGRLRLYRSVRQMKLTEKILELHNAKYNMAPIDAELKAREASLDALKRKFVQRDGDVVFKGTDISAYRVAALNRSQSVAEIAEDYPSLTDSMIRDAIDYEMIYPKKGKPYPARSLKRTLAEAGESLDPRTLDLLFGDDGANLGSD